MLEMVDPTIITINDGCSSRNNLDCICSLIMSTCINVYMWTCVHLYKKENATRKSCSDGVIEGIERQYTKV